MRFLFALISCLIWQSADGSGLSSWVKPTPGGNQMEYDGTSAYRAEVRWLNRPDAVSDSIYFHVWYFYRNHIIGERDNGVYLVADETTCTAITFHSVEAFNQYVEEHHLRPRLWKRSYDPIHPGEQWDNLLFAAFMLSPVVVPLLIFYLFILAGVLFFKKKRTRAKIIFLVALPLWPLIAAWLQAFPQSW
ncbi:MAG: hypothetical protein J7623_09195 [Chitinophaga sp.]|uniref:hypothetical protein n=1 Tax=Chitinophaga sp. TaxID=1869181 RepID=UPI001B240A26|nr:hypothetical protein [Chitinophaga sp.]MBO9728801.1 hypothetical protein [Chitinophaga sp.]